LKLIVNQGLYLQYFIFFVTYEWVPQAKALHYIRLERQVRNKHSRILSFGLQQALALGLIDLAA